MRPIGLVFYSCCNKLPQMQTLQTTCIDYLTVLESDIRRAPPCTEFRGSARLRSPAGGSRGESHPLTSSSFYDFRLPWPVALLHLQSQLGNIFRSLTPTSSSALKGPVMTLGPPGYCRMILILTSADQ